MMPYSFKYSIEPFDETMPIVSLKVECEVEFHVERHPANEAVNVFKVECKVVSASDDKGHDYVKTHPELIHRLIEHFYENHSQCSIDEWLGN